MEEPRGMEQAEKTIDLQEYVDILRPVWWKIVLLSFVVGIATLIWMMQKPNFYKASATIAPATDEGKQSPTIGALATFGVSVGGPSKAEDLEALFKSNDLAVRVFRKYSLWPILEPGRFDSKNGRMKNGWLVRLFGKESEDKTPGEWDAIRAAQKNLSVSVNRKSGTLSIAFEAQSAEGSALIVGYFLEEAKSRLQEEALARAGKNKKFIEEQIGKTVDALTRDRLYGLYGQEVEREMMARNREQFGFRIIDTQRAPDRKAGPARAKSAAVATILSFLLWFAIFIICGKKGTRREN